jgi:hypothetical protein
MNDPIAHLYDARAFDAGDIKYASLAVWEQYHSLVQNYRPYDISQLHAYALPSNTRR